MEMGMIKLRVLLKRVRSMQNHNFSSFSHIHAIMMTLFTQQFPHPCFACRAAPCDTHTHLSFSALLRTNVWLKLCATEEPLLLQTLQSHRSHTDQTQNLRAGVNEWDTPRFCMVSCVKLHGNVCTNCNHWHAASAVLLIQQMDQKAAQRTEVKQGYTADSLMKVWYWLIKKNWAFSTSFILSCIPR